ncbi:SDR family oxidoreductase [Chloroflexota bacterium]
MQSIHLLYLLTKSLARILAKDNIRVNCICPGPIDTDMLKSLWGCPTNEEEWHTIQKAKLDYTPMGRIARPEEIASVALFLASDESSFVTGVALLVDGGRLA